MRFQIQDRLNGGVRRMAKQGIQRRTQESSGISFNLKTVSSRSISHDQGQMSLAGVHDDNRLAQSVEGRFG
jgi:hypothetical protein